MFHDVRPTISQLTKGSKASKDCPVCGKNFKNRGSMRFHLLKSHGMHESSLEDLLGLKSHNMDAQLRIFCPYENCKLSKKMTNYFVSAKSFIQHFQKVHYEKTLKCENCSAKFALLRDLHYHEKKICPNRDKIEDGRNASKTGQLNDSKCQGRNPICKSSAMQTEKWLVPAKIRIIANFKRIQPRKFIGREHISTQTEIQGDQIIVQQNVSEFIYPYSISRTNDQIVQSVDVDNSNFQQYQHSYAQTIYPHQIDFAAQTNYGGTTGQIFLNPLRHCETQTPPIDWLRSIEST